MKKSFVFLIILLSGCSSLNYPAKPPACDANPSNLIQINNDEPKDD